VIYDFFQSGHCPLEELAMVGVLRQIDVSEDLGLTGELAFREVFTVKLRLGFHLEKLYLFNEIILRNIR
jgi:hypothetical protein